MLQNIDLSLSDSQRFCNWALSILCKSWIVLIVSLYIIEIMIKLFSTIKICLFRFCYMCSSSRAWIEMQRSRCRLQIDSSMSIKRPVKRFVIMQMCKFDCFYFNLQKQYFDICFRFMSVKRFLILNTIYTNCRK